MIRKDANTPDGWLREVYEAVERRRGTYVRSRFYVLEITPPQRYDYGNGHGGTDYKWTDRTSTRTSEYFDTKEEAEEFMNKHEPDPGKELRVAEGKLYRKTVEEWY